MCAVGDAKNEVLTTSELAKLKFDPNIYRVNACQGLVYDPMRKLWCTTMVNAVHAVYYNAVHAVYYNAVHAVYYNAVQCRMHALLHLSFILQARFLPT